MRQSRLIDSANTLSPANRGQSGRRLGPGAGAARGQPRGHGGGGHEVTLTHGPRVNGRRWLEPGHCDGGHSASIAGVPGAGPELSALPVVTVNRSGEAGGPRVRPEAIVSAEHGGCPGERGPRPRQSGVSRRGVGGGIGVQAEVGRLAAPLVPEPMTDALDHVRKFPVFPSSGPAVSCSRGRA